MKKLIAAIALSLTLAACQTNPHVPEKIEPTVVTKMEYVLRIPPAEAMELPPAVPDIDLDKAKQSDVAKWIAAMNQRMETFEAKLKQIAIFLKDEQDKLDKASK
jgi:hypothetical protein